jgi:polyphosphate glucokinase
MRVIVIDVGGSSVKVWNPEGIRLAKIASGPEMTPHVLATKIAKVTEKIDFDVISLGYPGKLANGRPTREPFNLGDGWIRFDFRSFFGKPLRMMNDAAMQALGTYRGLRLLFVGLGTSVGSALIADNVVIPLELGALPHIFGDTLEGQLSKKGLKRVGKRRWRDAINDAVPRLRDAFSVEDVVLGGGNAELLAGKLEPGIRIGTNQDAFWGGRRLWQCRDLYTTHIFEGSIQTSDNRPLPTEDESDAPNAGQATLPIPRRDAGT